MFVGMQLQFSSKVMFFMSKSSIVARRGCQLATTAPVLLFTWAIALCCQLRTAKQEQKVRIRDRQRESRVTTHQCYSSSWPTTDSRRPVNRQPGFRAKNS